MTRVLTRDLKVVGREVEVFSSTLDAPESSESQPEVVGKGEGRLGVSWHGQRACCRI